GAVPQWRGNRSPPGVRGVGFRREFLAGARREGRRVAEGERIRREGSITARLPACGCRERFVGSSAAGCGFSAARLTASLPSPDPGAVIIDAVKNELIKNEL